MIAEFVNLPAVCCAVDTVMDPSCIAQTQESNTTHLQSHGHRTVDHLKLPSFFEGLTRQRSKSFSGVLGGDSRKQDKGPAGPGSALSGSATSVSSAEHVRASPKTSPLLTPHRRFSGLKKAFPKKKHHARGIDGSESEESDVKVLYVPPERPKHFVKVLAQIRERAMHSSGARKRSKTLDHTSTTDNNRKSLNSSSSGTEGQPRRRGSFSMLTDEENLDSDCFEGATSSQEKEDAVDGTAVDYENQQRRTEQKMERTKKRLKELQEERDEFVKEYLESAETHTTKAVRVNFEKRNQKTNAAIHQLQKKLEKYHKALQDPEKSTREGISSGRIAKEVFKGVKENIKGISEGVRDGVIGAVTKPLEIANLIKNRKFGSAENVGTTGSSPGTRTDGFEYEPSSPGTLSEEQDRLIKTENDRYHGSSNLSPRYSDEDSSSLASGTHVSIQPAGSPRHSLPPSPPTYNQYESELTEVRDIQTRLQTSMEEYKHQMEYFNGLFQEERYKSESLQCQLNDLTCQWNDMTELHQNEMMSLKQELERAEERIELVEYRSAERAGEIEEALDTHFTRILKMEALQQQNQQMVGGLESYVDENMKAKALLSKLLTVVIAMLQILLILFTTAARIILPFTKTRCRLLLTSLVVILIAALWKYQEHENVLAVSNTIREHFMVFRDKVVSVTTPIRDFFNRKQRDKFNS